MEIDAQQITIHAERIANSTIAVDCEAGWNCVNGLPARFALLTQAVGVAALVEDASEIRFPDFVAVDCNLDPDGAGDGVAAAQVHDDLFNCLTGHLLCCVHGIADCVFGPFHADDGAVFDTLAGLLADTNDPRLAVCLTSRDETTSLARTNIQGRYQSSFCHYEINSSTLFPNQASQ